MRNNNRRSAVPLATIFCACYAVVVTVLMYSKSMVVKDDSARNATPCPNAGSCPTCPKCPAQPPSTPCPKESQPFQVPTSLGEPGEKLWTNQKNADYVRTKHGITEHYPNETIFIAMASLGDKECAPTIARAFQRAVHPDRIFFGIFQQHNCTGKPGNEDYCHDCEGEFHKHLNCPHHPVCQRQFQIRVTRIPMEDTLGVTVGRFMAEKHYRGETYSMNVDAHSQFMHGWDSAVINSWRQAEDEYAVLTTYPTGYDHALQGFPKDDNYEVPQEDQPMVICQTTRLEGMGGKMKFFRHRALRFKRQPKPVRAAFLAAGFNFCRGHRVKKVPYDPYTPFLFDGEELSFGARLWTHGYDLYHPNLQIVSHLYAKAGTRPLMWDHNWKKRQFQQLNSTRRINYILGLHDKWNKGLSVDEVDTREVDKYGLGKVRTIEQFYDWAHVYLEDGQPMRSESWCDKFESGGQPMLPRPGLE